MACVREDANVAQARVFITALDQHLRETKSKLARAEAVAVGPSSRARAMRLEANGLRCEAGGPLLVDLTTLGAEARLSCVAVTRAFTLADRPRGR